MVWESKKLFIGSDHGGYRLKEAIKKHFDDKGIEYTDCGSYSVQNTDYPDFALAVSQAVAGNPDSKGILICRSGEGMEIAANKVAKIRAALVWNVNIAQETRADNDANVLALPADYVDESKAINIVNVFLNTPFSGAARHVRRLEKLAALERARY